MVTAIENFQKPVLPLERMRQLLPDARAAYNQARPFPHIVLDDFFKTEVVDKILSEFPAAKDIKWIQYNDSHQKKLANENEENIGLFTRYVLYSLNSSTFLQFLEELTGITGLISDCSFRSVGLHNIYRGRKLRIHADFNKHQKFALDRKLNPLLYLNKDWKEEYTGHLELWDRKMKQCVQRILPIFNRIVIFSTTDYSFHGHPDPLNCPEHLSQKPLDFYYFQSRTGKEKSHDYSTFWKLMSGEELEGGYIEGQKFPSSMVHEVQGLNPPISPSTHARFILMNPRTIKE